MASSKIKASILCFPQSFDGNNIALNILFVPREDPLVPFITNLPAGTDAPAFANAALKFRARLIPSTEFLPGPSQPGHSENTITTIPDNAAEIFTELKNTFSIKLPSNELKPHPKSNTFIRKYLPESYRNAFDFSHPRSPKYGVTDDAYICAMRKEPVPGPKQFSTKDISWGKVFALAMRQPLLAKKLGILYKTSVTLPAPDYFKGGGWLYLDLSPDSDYFNQLQLDPLLIKKYAARIPKLIAPRVLFAPIQFLVTDTPQAGNFDTLFIEAADFNDGFANIVHCAQPQKANTILEANQQGLPPVKDFGIRIGWEDEQLLEWHNRLLRRPDHLPPATPPISGNELVDAPLGILSYRVDTREKTIPASQWNSLNKVTGTIKIGNIDLGLFDGELGVEVAPTQMDGMKEGVFWLPSYFTQWDGSSVVLRDDKAAELFGTNDTPKPLQPVGIDNVLLQYGKTYEFRVRMSDMSGDGPTEKDDPEFQIPSQSAACRFRRFVPPARLRIPSDKLVEPQPGDDPAFVPLSYEIFRPLLTYPSLLYTGFYTDAFNLLQADIPSARAEKREPAYADPDVTMLQVEVEVKGLEMDNFLSDDLTDSYYHLFTATRNFPDDPLEPLNLEINFQDANVLKFGDPADLGDLPLSGDIGPIVLPTARNIKITVTPLCWIDNELKYFGAEWVRKGQSTEIYTRLESSNESPIFINDIPAKQLKAILLQPDEVNDKNKEEQMALEGKRHETSENLINRLANALDLDTTAMTLMAKPGQRLIFGCCKSIRHILSPDHSTITFSSKSDLINHWITAIILTINRDWSWDGLKPQSFTIKRNGEQVGIIEESRIINDIGLQNPDRIKTTVIFFDAVDPKPENNKFPETLFLQYEVNVHIKGTEPDPEPLVIDIVLPVAVKPAQTPKVVSAGIALSPYERDNEGYSWTTPRRKMLWLEFEEPVLDPNDNYFVFVKSYAPDPLLILYPEFNEQIKENRPYIDPEWIRIITPGQSDDFAALTALQQMIPAGPSADDPAPRHFLVPLPPGLNEVAPELFGFFVYEICVGHSKVWCTAQSRYGRSIKLTGVQHPAPSLICSVIRTDDEIIVSAPFANAVYDGMNMTQYPVTELWVLLYAQVTRVDGKDHRNILIDQQRMWTTQDRLVLKKNPLYGRWSNNKIREMLEAYAISTEAPLSCMVVELLPNKENDPEPLSSDLGYTRIYRTSQLEPVPQICCVDC